ncbi:MAG: hypothetical protein EHM19_05920 [Candidatus Latescibacterota bacterium]|nr:MAG: hypothetical protein EHM19_05920 [Candidatus Latescibacterota bacterium]
MEAASPPPPAPPEPDPWELAREPVPDDGRPLVILYTSGTGGRPKGVVLSRAAFVASAAASAANLGWEDGDLWAIALPLGHVGGFSIVTRCLLARRPVLLAAPFDAASLARAIDERRVTLLSLVPAMVRRLLDHDPSWGPPRALRAVLVGGGPLSEALLEEALARGLRLLPSYGLTETCSQIAAWPYGTRPTAPIARALAAAELRIREGRILVRGPMLLTSYFPQGAHPCPFIEDGWLETSDFGEIDESGFLRVLGRADELLVTGGENVSPFEIEAEIERFPGVRAACVFGVREDPWGDVIAVAIVLASGAALDSELLAAHLARALAPHKRPRRFALVPSLPLAPSGKVDRAAVAARSPLLLLPLRPRGEPFSTRSDP